MEIIKIIDYQKEQLISQGAGFSLMSGSGSTVFGVFDSRDRAESASRSFKGFWTAVAETITDQGMSGDEN